MFSRKCLFIFTCLFFSHALLGRSNDTLAERHVAKAEEAWKAGATYFPVGLPIHRIFSDSENPRNSVPSATGGYRKLIDRIEETLTTASRSAVANRAGDRAHCGRPAPRRRKAQRCGDPVSPSCAVPIWRLLRFAARRPGTVRVVRSLLHPLMIPSRTPRLPSRSKELRN